MRWFWFLLLFVTVFCVGVGRVNVYDTSGNKYKYTFINETFTCKKEWQYYKFTGKAKLGVDGGNECKISFYSVYGTGAILHIKNFKIRTSVDIFNKEI